MVWVTSHGSESFCGMGWRAAPSVHDFIFMNSAPLVVVGVRTTPLAGNCWSIDQPGQSVAASAMCDPPTHMEQGPWLGHCCCALVQVAQAESLVVVVVLAHPSYRAQLLLVAAVPHHGVVVQVVQVAQLQLGTVVHFCHGLAVHRTALGGHFGARRT